MNANQINKHLRPFGVIIRRAEHRGVYYYWDTVDHSAFPEADSVYVNSADQIPLEQWIALAKAAAATLQRPKPLPKSISLLAGIR